MIKMHKKAQISIDFTMAITLALMFFILILYSAHSQLNELDSVVQSLDAKHVSEKLAIEINSVYLSGNNAAKNITLPETIHGGKIYTLRVYPRSTMVNYSSGEGENFYSHRILTRINGIEAGLELTPGKIQIQNINGTISLRNV